MTQCSFGRENAQQALAEFLAGDHTTRTIHERADVNGYGHGDKDLYRRVGPFAEDAAGVTS